MPEPVCTRSDHCACGAVPVLKAKRRQRCGQALPCATAIDTENDGPDFHHRYKQISRAQELTIYDYTDPVEVGLITRECSRVIEIDTSVETDPWVTLNCPDGFPSCGTQSVSYSGCDDEGDDLAECGDVPLPGTKCYAVRSEVISYGGALDLRDGPTQAALVAEWIEDEEFSVEAFEEISGSSATNDLTFFAVTWTIRRFGPRVPWQISYTLVDTDTDNNVTETDVVLSVPASQQEVVLSDLEEAPGLNRSIIINEVHFGRDTLSP